MKKVTIYTGKSVVTVNCDRYGFTVHEGKYYLKLYWFEIDGSEPQKLLTWIKLAHDCGGRYIFDIANKEVNIYVELINVAEVC